MLGLLGFTKNKRADIHVYISALKRKMRDSNPRYPEEGIPDFESSAFGHSANLPLTKTQIKCRKPTARFKVFFSNSPQR